MQALPNNEDYYPERAAIYQRALSYLPGSYKLWYNFLKESREFMKQFELEPNSKDEDDRPSNHQTILDLHEASLKYMYNMPRIWLDYAEFAANDCQLITQTKDIYDRALQTLPVTQHRKIWQSYADWALNLGRQDYEEASLATLLHELPTATAPPVFTVDTSSCEVQSLFTSVSLPILWRFIAFEPSSREAFADYLFEMDCLDDLIALYW